ncbi:MAG: energy transducer TonB [Deltaproteobacteria bacterium]|nr:energy transducer TonB [Deltaproteobacteria bacterium]
MRSEEKPARVLPWLVTFAVHGALALLTALLPQPPAPERRPPIELTSRKLPERRAVTPPTPRPEEPKPPEPPRRATRRKVTPSEVEVPAKKPAEPPPEGDPASKTPAAPDTGAAVPGVDMAGGTRAPAGQGVQVPAAPKGPVTPGARRVGQGTREGRGFKKDYQKGEQAPVAVVTTMPQVLRRIEATYPERVRELGIEGRVVLELSVDGAGKVTAARVIRGLHPELDAAAVVAAKQMLFAPARVGGTAVAVKIPYTFTFVLD